LEGFGRLLKIVDWKLKNEEFKKTSLAEKKDPVLPGSSKSQVHIS
jgi:hypothetical protein